MVSAANRLDVLKSYLIGTNQRDTIEVTKYGAVGDGKHDDTEAFKAAIAAADTAKVNLAIPGGTYLIGDITIPGRLTIRGAGRDRTILKYTGTGSAFANATPGTRLFDWVVERLTLTTTTGAIGFDLDSISTSVFRDMKVSGFSDSGVYIHSSVSGGAVYNRFYAVTAQSCNVGFKLRGTSSNANIWHGCRGNVCTTCWDLQDSNDNTLEACQAESSTTGIFIDSTIPGGSSWHRITNCRLEHLTNGIVINSSAVWDTHISGLWSDGSTTTVIADSGTRTHRAGDLFTVNAAGTIVSLPSGTQVVSGSNVNLGTSTSAVAAATASTLYLRGNAANGASALGVVIGNGTTLSTAGARIVAFSADTPVTHAQIVSGVDVAGSYVFASGVKIMEGTGTPEGAVTAPVGSLYLRRDGGAGTSHYVKESGSGNTGWVGK